MPGSATPAPSTSPTVGASSGWCPYPFLDVGEEGAVSVAVTSVVITLLILGVMALIGWLDRRLPALSLIHI